MIARNFQCRKYESVVLAFRAVTTNSNAEAIRRADDEYQVGIFASPFVSNKRTRLDIDSFNQ